MLTLRGGGNPSWSPHGTKLAFVRSGTSGGDTDPSDVYLVRRDGSGLRRLVDELGPDGYFLGPRVVSVDWQALGVKGERLAARHLTVAVHRHTHLVGQLGNRDPWPLLHQGGAPRVRGDRACGGRAGQCGGGSLAKGPRFAR
jgi:WD40 repeat protein